MTIPTAPDRLPVDAEVDELLERVTESGDEITPEQRAELDAILLSDSRRMAFGMMRAAAQLKAEIQDRRAWVAMIAAEVERDLAPRIRSLEWVEGQIEDVGEVLLVGKSKTVTIPGLGKIAYFDHQAWLSIADDEAFMGALSADERAVLIEQRPHLKRNDAKAYAQRVHESTGALLPGVERIEAQRTASIRYAAGDITK